MTKKEKKELALKLKAEIDAKHRGTKKAISGADLLKLNNHKRRLLDKAKNRSGDIAHGTKYRQPKKKDEDFEKW